MNETTQGRAQWLADFLERQPLAGFLALTILALLGVFVLLMLEMRGHRKTLGGVVELTTTFAKQWDRHLDLEERMIEHERSPMPMPTTHQERQ